MDAPTNRPLSRAELRKFGLTVGPAFGALAGLAAWRGHGTVAVVLGSLAGLLIAAGLVSPGSLAPVERAWMGLARAISKVTTPIFLGIVYYLVLTPVGLLRRTLGRHPLRHPETNDGFWRDRGEARRSDLERQF